MPLVQPMPVPRFQFFDVNGDPVRNGFLYTFVAGTNTPLASYNDHTGSVGALNPNPVQIDSGGYADVWLTAASYKLVLQDSNHVQIWSIDGVPGLGSLITVGDLLPLFTSQLAGGALNFTLEDAAAGSLFGRFAGTVGPPSFGAIGSDGQISYNNGGQMAGDSDLIWSDVPANKQLLLVAGVLRFANLVTGAKIQDQGTSLDIASENVQDIKLGSIGDEASRFRMGTSNSGQFFFQIAAGPARLNLNDGLNAAGTFQGPAIIVGQGDPENTVTARVGSLFLRTDGGAATTLYVKETGTGNTGWIVK